MAIKKTSVKFVTGKNSGIVVNYGTADALTTNGVQSMGLCLGFSVNTVEVGEAGTRFSFDAPVGAKYEKATTNYNFRPGEKSIEFFRGAAANGDLVSNIRLYAKIGCDFSAPDLISDPSSGMYFGSMTDPKFSAPGSLYQGSFEYWPAGPFVLFVAHKTGDALTYTALTRTLESDDSDFITLGFEEGDTIIIDNIPGEDGPKYFKAASVAAGAIVFAAAVGDVADMSDWIGGATTSAHAATPLIIDELTC